MDDTEKPEASWTIQLNVDCPHCDEYIDLMDMDNFWEYGISPLESVDSKDVICPECEKSFNCSIVY